MSAAEAIYPTRGSASGLQSARSGKRSMILDSPPASSNNSSRRSFSCAAIPPAANWPAPSDSSGASSSPLSTSSNAIIWWKSSGPSAWGDISSVFALTDAGRKHAQGCLENNQYAGTAPVPLWQYVAAVRAQRLPNGWVAPRGPGQGVRAHGHQLAHPVPTRTRRQLRPFVP